MDPRHPVVGFIANTIALISIIALLFSLLLPIITPKGWNMIENILVGSIVLSFAVSYWAKREREVLVVHAHGGSESQYMQLEDMPTMVSGNSQVDFVNTNTAAVINSIVGQQTAQTKSQVDGAIGVLSSGEIGKSSAAAVEINQVQHTKVNLQQSNVELPVQSFESVPLPVSPSQPVEHDVAAMIDLDDLLGENNSQKTQIDLPELPDF